MELFKVFIQIIDSNLIYCLVPLILTLKLIDFIFEKRFETRKFLNIVRWFILGYTSVVIVFHLTAMVVFPQKYTLARYTVGSYRWIPYLMVVSTLILPFSLLVQKVGANFWYVSFVSIFMKLGVYVESILLLTTDLHRDYLPNYESKAIMDSILGLFGMVILQGILIGVIGLGIFEISKYRKR